MTNQEVMALIQKEHQALLALVYRAGEAIMSVRNDQKELGILFKSDDSPVTRADFDAHNILYDGLRELTPQILIVSEEDDSTHFSRVNTSSYWLVDPLDGTKEFINGYEDFTVNIALIVRDIQGIGQTRFGVVGFPARGVLYSGGQGLGARRHVYDDQVWWSEPIKVMPPQTPLRVVISRSHLSRETLEYVGNLGVPIELIKAGSASKFCMIAEGKADLYPRLSGIKEWDIAAGQAVLEGAMGQMKGLDDGLNLTYGECDHLEVKHFIAIGGE